MPRKPNSNLNNREVIFLASQNKTKNLGLCQFGNDDIPDWRTDYTGDMDKIDRSIKTISDEVAEVKKSVSDRNTKIATAITEKGVATEPTDSADTMAENIGKIQTGISLTQIIETTTTTSNCADIKTIATHEAYTE
nr:MAG TPA: hypothetical protein [Bacteriophage sp.]